MSLAQSDHVRPPAVLTQRPSVPTWVFAAVGAVALHAGAAGLAYLHLQTDANETDFGAQAIEVGLEMTAPHTDQTDLPPGPAADDSAASTAQVEQQTKVEDTALPKDTPTETPDPDRVVMPDANKPPKDEEPKPQAQAAKAAAESTASEAAAPPPSPTAVEAPKSVAPAIGTGDSARRVEATWERELVAYLDRHKRYPAGIAVRSAQILVTFTIDRTGHILKSEIATSSGSPAFDNAALEMMRRSDPVPPPPPVVADNNLTFSVPVVFRKDRHR